jgi:adenylate cyclase
MSKYATAEDEWRAYLTGKHPELRRHRYWFRYLPGDPRCNFCLSPFGQPGSWIVHLMGKQPSNLNPFMCNT